MSRSRTSMRVATVSPTAASTLTLEPEPLKEHGQGRIRHDDEDDPGDDGRRGGRTDRGRAAPALHAPETPGDRHEDAEDRGLDDSRGEVVDPDRLDRPVI